MGASGAGDRQRQWNKAPKVPKRRLVLTDEEIRHIHDMKSFGFSTGAIAQQFGLSTTTIEKILKEASDG